MSTFRTKDDILTPLMRPCYLTYDRKSGEAFILNQEIVQEFLRLCKTGGWDGLMQAT
ncbi:hypothetical protein [Acetatifactor aquisgranensis]|uniref:hypothetical protein n=1 Tax=Acetatifactor aquisgranensis TaxID=2941233 RepID=UPI002040E6B3|nr:hypothetical protein [Acetatifactor aquisgranensis]